jgi:hypothetical protein
MLIVARLPTGCHLLATVTLIVTRISMDCQPLGYCHADCYLDIRTPESAKISMVLAAFKVGISCLVPFNRAYSIHRNEPMIIVIH